MATADRTPLIDDGKSLRKRSRQPKSKNGEEQRYDADWDPSLPYGGKVFLARRKKPDPRWFIVLEVGADLVLINYKCIMYCYISRSWNRSSIL